MFGSQLTPVVKNLLLANLVVFGLTVFLGMSLAENFGLRFVMGSDFQVFQIITYMFLHGGLHHILSNMFGLLIFGPVLEYRFGSQRFLTFYLVCGIGAALLHQSFYVVQYLNLAAEVKSFIDSPSPESLISFVESTSQVRWRESVYEFVYEVYPANPQDPMYISRATDIVSQYAKLRVDQFNTPMVGASGAIFGILMGFGLLYPNLQLFLLFPPIPIRAKYLVTFYGVYELISVYQQRPDDNIAHLAHLGGMLMAFIMIRLWKNKI